MVELSWRHPDTDEQAWECKVKLELKDGTTDVEDVSIISSMTTSMGEVLDHVDKVYAKELEQNNSKILSYCVVSLMKVKHCACCYVLIDDNETYCPIHKEAVASILKRWDKDVDGI